MPNAIGRKVASAAVALRRSHPHAPPLDVLDVVMRRRAGSLRDFEDVTWPGSDFGAILASAFDRGMSAEEWRVVDSPSADPALVNALLGIWRTEVLPAFSARYGLAL